MTNDNIFYTVNTAERYDYEEAVKSDVLDYIAENIDFTDFDDIDELEDYLQDSSDLWLDDAVTGSASGSYWCNSWKAEECLCHNLDLLEEACAEFGDSVGDALGRGAETCDVIIRCYLLGSAIAEALESVEDIEKYVSIREKRALTK